MESMIENIFHRQEPRHVLNPITNIEGDCTLINTRKD